MRNIIKLIGISIIFFVQAASAFALTQEEIREMLKSRTHTLSWAYYTDCIEGYNCFDAEHINNKWRKWYISSILPNNSYTGDVYALTPIKNNINGWGTVGKDVAAFDLDNYEIIIQDNLDTDPSDIYFDVGWNEYAEDAGIHDWRRWLQGTTVPLKWYFFNLQGTGNWYIINTPLFSGVYVWLFAAKDGEYDWRPVDTTGFEPIFFKENETLYLKFGGGEPVSWDLYEYPVLPYAAGSYGGRSFYYDNIHLGEDINLSEGTPIRAIGDGIIKYYGSATGYGNLVVVIEHELDSNIFNNNTFHFYEGHKKSKTLTNSKFCSIYGHLRKESLNWTSGSWVSKGDIIGFVENRYYNGDGHEHLHMGIFGGSHPGTWAFHGYEGSPTYANVQYFVSAKELLNKLKAGLDVSDFWMKNAPYYHGSQINFDANFKLKNITNSPITFEKWALAIHSSDNTPLFDLQRVDSPTTMQPGDSTGPLYGEGAITSPGSYVVVAKVFIKDAWVDLASQNITVY